MLWSEKDNLPTAIYTAADLATCTHIIYLDISSHTIQKQRQDDECRKDRPNDSIEHIRKHKQAEMAKLQQLCREIRILFMSVQQPERISPGVPRSLAPVQLLGSSSAFTPDAMLAIDSDKTLAPLHPGIIFWDPLCD